MNSKGISPLIATIFLIAVAVALGSIVMSIGQEYVTQASSLPPSSCADVSFEIKAVSLENDVLSFTVDNQGTRIDGWLIKLFSEDYAQAITLQLEESVGAYDVAVYSLPVTFPLLYEVSFTPLEGVDSFVPCNAKTLTILRSRFL